MHGDIIILHMWSINDNHMIYGSWDIECDGQSFLSFSDIFSLLPSNDPKNGDIILHMCTIMKIIWYMVPEIWRVTENFLSFWTIFCPFIPLKTKKSKFWINWKKLVEISSFYSNAPKIIVICGTVPEIWCMTDIILVFYFGLFLLFTVILYRHFYTFVPKIMITWCTVPEIWCMMDGQMKWHI